MVRPGPKSGQHPGHGAGAGTWAELGVRLPSGQFQDLGPPPLCVTWFSPRKQLNMQTGGARTSSCFVQPQNRLVTSWHLGSLGLTLQSRLNLEWAPCPASPLIQGPQGRGGQGESGTPGKNRWHVPHCARDAPHEFPLNFTATLGDRQGPVSFPFSRWVN